MRFFGVLFDTFSVSEPSIWDRYGDSISTVAASAVAFAIVSGGRALLVAWSDRSTEAQEQELVERQESLRSEIKAQAAKSEEAGTGEAAESKEIAQLSRRNQQLNDELDAAADKLREIQSTVPFEKEARNAKWSSTVAFFFGLVVIVSVIAIGAQEWLDSRDPVDLSTGSGLARLGVVAAAFYLAGQLFRRSTFLQVRAQEMERSAIAMRTAQGLAGELSSREEGDAFLRAVYQRHLTGDAPTNAEEAAEPALDPVKLIESVNKLRL